jgi:hypothetical protein
MHHTHHAERLSVDDIIMRRRGVRVSDNSLLEVIKKKFSCERKEIIVDLVSCGRVILAIIFSDKTREMGYAGIQYERVSTPPCLEC